MANRQAKKMSLPPEIFTIIHPYLSLRDISSLVLTNREVNKWVDMNEVIREYYVSLMDRGNIINAACGRGFINLLTHLHRSGASIPDDAIIWAANRGHLPIVEYLHKNGVDIFADNDYPIRVACSNGHLPIVEYLHKHGANISADYDYPIKWACRHGHLPIVEYLHKNGVSVSVYRDKPIIWARHFGHYHIVEYLRKNGARL